MTGDRELPQLLLVRTIVIMMVLSIGAIWRNGRA
jgi:hypothetical protein